MLTPSSSTTGPQPSSPLSPLLRTAPQPHASASTPDRSAEIPFTFIFPDPDQSRLRRPRADPIPPLSPHVHGHPPIERPPSPPLTDRLPSPSLSTPSSNLESSPLPSSPSPLRLPRPATISLICLEPNPALLRPSLLSLAHLSTPTKSGRAPSPSPLLATPLLRSTPSSRTTPSSLTSVRPPISCRSEPASCRTRDLLKPLNPSRADSFVGGPRIVMIAPEQSRRSRVSERLITSAEMSCPHPSVVGGIRFGPRRHYRNFVYTHATRIVDCFSGVYYVGAEA